MDIECLENKPKILNYLDYRKYLKDYYTYMKKVEPKFSFRSFARKVGLSGSYLKHLIDGRYHLSNSQRGKIASACGFSKEERSYFYKLIDFNKASTLEEQNRCLKKINREALKHTRREISGEQYKLLSEWYFIAIRNLVNLKGFKADPQYMAQRLRGLITPKEAEAALKVLDQLGLVYEKNGHYHQSEKHLVSKDEIQSTAIRNYHAKSIPLGVKALDKNDLAEREMRALTMSVTKEDALMVKDSIKKYYTELVSKIAASNKKKRPDDLWQLNFQFFKLTEDL